MLCILLAFIVFNISSEDVSQVEDSVGGYFKPGVCNFCSRVTFLTVLKFSGRKRTPCMGRNANKSLTKKQEEGLVQLD